MATDKLIRASDARRAILKEDPKLAYCIDSIPGVDAVPVVHGRWERTDIRGFLRCSNCRDVYIADEWFDNGKWHYCPNCGAKMDGDGND